VDDGGREFEQRIPISGSSWDPPLVEPGRYRPGWLTPRGRSDPLLLTLAMAARAGHPMPEIHWPVTAALMRVPLVGRRLWRRRFVARFSAGLRELGYRIETVVVDDADRSVVVHARLIA
jgi:hypothetical protein